MNLDAIHPPYCLAGRHPSIVSRSECRALERDAPPLVALGDPRVRHAFDADHISAIDNPTRKFMSEGKRPLSIGFFFSLEQLAPLPVRSRRGAAVLTA